MTYLVTGCAGFIASRVTARLLAAGHDVHGVDNLNDAYDPELKRWRLAQLKGHARFTFRQADVADLQDMEPVFRESDIDAVFNLAARAGVRQSLVDPWVYLETNGTGTLNLLELCRRHDVRKFALASTSSLYGLTTPRPFREEASTDRPLSPYASSKKAAESVAAAYSHLYGIDAPVLRYFTVYGPAGRPDMSIFRIVRWIAEGDAVTVYGDGSQERDFTFVEDIARGTIAALGVKGFEIINLGSDSPVPLIQVIRGVERLVGRPAEIRWGPTHPADVKATWADIGKARRLLDWQPFTGLEEGLQATVEWYLKNREWACKIALGEV